MIFEVFESENYLAVNHPGGVYKVPRWFCREVGLKPGRWEIVKNEEGILLQQKDDHFFQVVRSGRHLRAICLDRFCEVTGIDISKNPGCYSLKEVK